MRRRFALTVTALLSGAVPALADDRVAPVADLLVRQECGECHMAFQPAFLPARSWARLMDDLANHFGEDVSLPPDKASAIRAYLTANAGDAKGGRLAGKYMRWVAPAGTPLRITENPAFLRRHAFADRVWKDPKVVTKSNCPACHQGADRGMYEDD